MAYNKVYLLIRPWVGSAGWPATAPCVAVGFTHIFVVSEQVDWGLADLGCLHVASHDTVGWGCWLGCLSSAPCGLSP